MRKARARRRAGGRHRFAARAHQRQGLGSGAIAPSGRAPKAVLSTIAGMDDARAWALRTGTALRCREALDSMIGLDHETAWEIRETCLEIWPPSVIKSLGVLVNGARGRDLLDRALARFADQISLLKQAAIIATGANLDALRDGGLSMSPFDLNDTLGLDTHGHLEVRGGAAADVDRRAAGRVPGISPLAAPAAERAAARARGRPRPRR